MEKIIFLDRDGVISIFTPNDFIKKWEEFKFLPDAIEGLKILTDAGYKIVIISNQSGVGKKIFTEEDLNEITENMKKILFTNGIEIYRVYYCTHTEKDNCNCRKPKPGLFLKAREEIGNIDFSKTFFIGDSEKDVIAGKTVGTKTILVLSGETKSKKETEKWEIKPDYIFKNLKESAEFIIGRKNEEI